MSGITLTSQENYKWYPAIFYLPCLLCFIVWFALLVSYSKRNRKQNFNMARALFLWQTSLGNNTDLGNGEISCLWHCSIAAWVYRLYCPVYILSTLQAFHCTPLLAFIILLSIFTIQPCTTQCCGLYSEEAHCLKNCWISRNYFLCFKCIL